MKTLGFLIISLLLFINTKGQEDNVLGVRLGDACIYTADTGIIGGTEIVAYFIKGDDNIVTQIIILPTKNGKPTYITSNEYNSLLYSLSDSFGLLRASHYSEVNRLTLIFNKIDYEVIIKLKSFIDLNSVVIIIKSL